MPLANKQILLVITGGIAAYKSLELIRLLKKDGANVRCILTKAGSEFVTPLSISALTENPVYQDLWSLTDESEMGHIRLSRESDLIVIAPATANIIAKMAQGIADDLASTCLLASNKPIMIAPAMNVEMWNNISTQENLNLLQKRGIDSLDPTIGEMACGEIGVGRMVEPQVIFESIQEFFATTQNLNGKKILVTAGATIEPIDPVRYISNFSSGKQGYAIAKSLAMRGADVTIISGKTNLQPPSNVKIINVTTADEMYMAAAKELHQQYDAAICTAAVADYKPVVVAPQKLKKRDSNETLTITLTQNPDILKFIATSDKRPKLVIGFAAETENLLNNARAKLTSKSCDWIIANHVGETHNPVFGSDQNTVTILSNDAPDQYLGTHSKLQIANMISDQIGKWFNNANIETKENKNVRTIRS